MTTLKPLTLKGLNASQTNNFKLDSDIVSTNFTNAELCKKYGINQSRISNRKASLVTRGHLNASAKAVAKTLPTTSLVLTPCGLIGEVVVPKIVKEVSKPKNTNPYNDNGLNKEVARNKMSNYIVNSDTVGTILSLPFSTCKIEKKILLERPNYNFLGVEFDEPTFNDLKDTVKAEKLPIKTYFGKLGDKIYGTHENTYSHIIADYCGQLPTFSNEIEYAIRNKVVETNGIIAMTFSKPIRGTSNHSKFILGLGGTISNNPNDNRCDSDKATEAYFNRIIGNDFQFVEIFNYTDPNEETGMGCPMTLVILKRIK